MDAEQGALVIVRLRANWPQTDLTPTQVDVWLDALRDVTFEDGAVAADACIADLDRYTFPQVAQFRDRAKAARRRREGTAQRQLEVPPATDEQRAASLAALRRVREIVRDAPPLPVSRPSPTAPEPEARPIGRPPEPCHLDDHRYCKSRGPIRPLNSPTDTADRPREGTPPSTTKEQSPR